VAAPIEIGGKEEEGERHADRHSGLSVVPIIINPLLFPYLPGLLKKKEGKRGERGRRGG